MDWIAVLALVAVVGLLAAWWWTRRRDTGAGDEAGTAGNGSRDKRVEALDTVAGWPPEPTRVLTQGERRAHALLVQALPEHMVLAQVPLARFIRVTTRNSYHEWMRRVGQLCADLVVCDAGAQVLAVIEVRRGPGRDTERSRKRHDRMERVLQQAGVHLLVWAEDGLPHPGTVRDQVLTTPKGLHSEEGSVSVRTREAPGRRVVQSIPSGEASPLISRAATLEEVLEEIDRQAPRSAQLTDPTPSAWLDEFESDRMPLEPMDPLRR